MRRVDRQDGRYMSKFIQYFDISCVDVIDRCLLQVEIIREFRHINGNQSIPSTDRSHMSKKTQNFDISSV